MTKYLIGVDLGTSACKTVIFSLEGKKISDAQREYPIYHPKPTWAEQKPLEWWKAAVETIRESIKKAGIKEDEIVGVSVDSQREAVVPISKEGKELYNSIIWLDGRTRLQAERIKNAMSEEEILSITGSGINLVFSASKILWLKEKEPRVFEKTKVFLCAKDYIVYKLTGQPATDYSMASRTLLFDIKKRRWSEEICSAIGISIDKLPPVKESIAIIGEATSEASKETLLPRGVPVVNGGGDRPCECLGAGAVHEGQVNIGTGTGTAVEVPLTTPRIDEKARIPCCCHVIPDTWEYEAIIATTGASLRWFRDQFGTDEKAEAERTGRSPYDILVEEASHIKPGSDGLLFYPYLTGAYSPKFNEKVRGVFFGVSVSHTKAHFIRAILEGIAFQYFETFKILEDLGVKIETASMVGGETRSETWNQIKADITGIEIRIPEVDDAAALGAALLAGTGTGEYSSLRKAAEETVRVKKIYKPKADSRKAYLEAYKRYRTVYKYIERAYEAL
ncbi:xylulokinase [Candidatus Bathyarchaeota archaeon]|nr:MAG: xylulokinase [Candidatus Bathyarchaeota archaeon]